MASESPPRAEEYLSDQEREELGAFFRRYWPVGPPIGDEEEQSIARTIAGRRAELDAAVELLPRFLDAADSVDEKLGLVRSAAWRYLPSETAMLRWASQLVQDLERRGSQPEPDSL